MRHSDQARSRRALKRQHEAKRAIFIQTALKGGQHNLIRPHSGRPGPARHLFFGGFTPISAPSSAIYLRAGD